MGEHGTSARNGKKSVPRVYWSSSRVIILLATTPIVCFSQRRWSMLARFKPRKQMLGNDIRRRA